MYKQLKKQLDDQKIIRATRYGIEERIRFKIDTQLGLKGMTFSDVKIEMIGSNVDDKFLKVFASIERLDKERQELQYEEEIIEKMKNDVERKISNLNNIEHKIFRDIYIWGLTQKETAEREDYTIDRIKQICRDIKEKLKK